MKRFFLVAASAAFLFACETKVKTTESTTEDSVQTTNNEVVPGSVFTASEGDVRYVNGEVQVYRSGSWVKTDEDVKVDDGITVRRNGRVVRNGEEVELEDGTVVTKTGRFFDKAGNAIEDGWDGVKKGFKNAKEEVKDVFRDDDKKKEN